MSASNFAWRASKLARFGFNHRSMFGHVPVHNEMSGMSQVKGLAWLAPSDSKEMRTAGHVLRATVA